MREILFRGEDVRGLWHHGLLAHIGNAWYISNKAGISTAYEVIPKTIGQYTGLTDKNGKMIFEGDICRFREWICGEMCWIGRVHFEHQQFVISGGTNVECGTPFTLVMSRFASRDIEVIGNTHDNPELLGEIYGGADNG